MILPLQLRHRSTPEGAADAWFLPGGSAARWLEELARCGLANTQTRLYVVPVSVQDRTPAGLLVLPDRPGPPARQPVGMACRVVADRLFLPLEAGLDPPVTDAEVRSLCLLPVTFFHPVHGLSGFGAESALRVWDLLEPPPQRVEHWNLARPGGPALPVLEGIVLAVPPSLEDIFGDAGKEIGSEPLKDLPPAAGEPGRGLAEQTGRGLRWMFAKGLAQTIGHIPHTGDRRTWLNNVEDWARRQLSGIGDQLDRIRHQEVHRLIELFKNDPEAALRHAIPMNHFAHRGVAPPGGRLGARSPNFDPGRLGGGPVDVWALHSSLQETLRQRYRETADREMRLGRFRRAAYIYAELLGDLVSAANALKQGGHFRDAALLYEEHLKAPLDAARCFAEGGLLAEAIERYQTLGRWLDVAGLEERRGGTAAAARAVRKVVEERLAQDDILGAAALLDERLKETDEALERLLDAWPASAQAGRCVSAAFDLLARLGRHEAALERMARFRREPVPRPLTIPLLAALEGQVRRYPHETVRHQAADFSRVLIARQLARADLPESEGAGLIQALKQLAPEDRLLARDANRHLADRRDRTLRTRRSTPPPLANRQPTLLRHFELPRQITWMELRSEWHWFYAIGVTANRLTLIRGVWDGELQSLSWGCPTETIKRNGLIFDPTNEQGRAVTLALPGSDLIPVKRFPATDAFFGQECTAGTPPWWKPQHWPVAYGGESLWAAHLAADRAVLSCHDGNGRLQRTHDLTEELLDGAGREEQTRLSLAAVGTGQAAIALGNRLVVLRGAAKPLRLELPGQVIRLVPTLPHTRPGVAVLLDQGAVMHWAGAPGLIELDRDIVAPCGAFIPGGPMVLVSGSHMLLLEHDAAGVKGVVRAETAGQRLIGVSATDNAGEFAVLSQSGIMNVYRVGK